MIRAAIPTSLQRRTDATSAPFAFGMRRPVAPPVVHEVLRTPGAPLDRKARAIWEPHFNHDFSGVRLHTGSLAADSARSVGAMAYTVGRNIVFGSGQFQPGTAAGDRLLAHELTHVIQQREHAPRPAPALSVAPADSPFEREAETAAATGGGARPTMQTAEPAIQRTATETGTKTSPGSQGSDDPCAGWLQDHQSMSKRAAEHYVSTELGGDHGAVKKITCDMSEPNGAFACTVTFEDGTPIRVIVRPDSIVVGKFPLQTMNPPADQPLCWYAFSCHGPNRDLVLTKIKCQSAKAPDQGTSQGNNKRGPNP